MTFRKLTGNRIVGPLHLWLGLASGLVVFVLGITGCILVFEQEIKSITRPYLHITPPAQGTLLPPSRLKAIAEQEVPGKPVKWVYYPGREKSACILFYGADPDYYYQVYIHPYSGEVLKVLDVEKEFFHFILHGHYYLWLPPAVGQPFVASATLIFVVLLLSGLILWWPRNKKAARQRFRIQWSARWRRVNYDLHHVLGFYVMLIALVMALTGLVWGFQWFAQSVYWVSSGGETMPTYDAMVSDTTLAHAGFQPGATDKVWLKVLRTQQPAETAAIYVSFPDSRAAPIQVNINHRPGTYYKQDIHSFDQYTLQPIPPQGVFSGTYEDAGFAKKLSRMNYDIHVGAILGLPGKILAFFVSPICASLPVTGFYIWWGRKYKQRTKRWKQQAPGSSEAATKRKLSVHAKSKKHGPCQVSEILSEAPV